MLIEFEVVEGREAIDQSAQISRQMDHTFRQVQGRVAGLEAVAITGGEINVAVRIGSQSVTRLPDGRKIVRERRFVALVGDLAAELGQGCRIVAQNRAAGLIRLSIAVAAKRYVEAAIGFEQARTLQVVLRHESPFHARWQQLEEMDRRRLQQIPAIAQGNSVEVERVRYP